MKRSTRLVLRTILNLTLIYCLFSLQTAFAAPDPRDSIILESKVIGPVTGTNGVVRMRVSITNKDSLSNITLPLEEVSLSNGAYLILSYPRNFNGVVNRLTSTLGSTRVFVGNRYNSTSPDSFTIAGFYDPADPSTIEPPNDVRKDFWEIKFDSAIVNPGGSGLVQFDSIRILANSIGFVDIKTPIPQAIDVNFVRSTFQIGFTFTLGLLSPTNSAIVLERRPTFVWNTLQDTAAVAATYTVFLATNPGFSPADSSPPLTDTLWQVPADLQFQTTYYWKVRAITGRPDTVFSQETRTFRVDAPPTMPLDLYPSSGADISVNDFLVWLEGEDPDPGDLVTYQIQIDDNPNFSSPEVDEGGIDENTQPATGPMPPMAAPAGNAIAIQLKTLTQNDNLKDDLLYYWRVRTVDNHGLGSNYTSGTRNFFLNLADSSPRVPVPITPADDSVLTVHRPDFTSASTTDPDPADPPSSLRYTFRIDTDGEVTADFLISFTTAPGETTFTVADSLAENGHFFWAVRAMDSKGARSAFSTVQEFFINAQNEPPAAFDLLSPGDGSFIVTKTPTLDWEDAVDPDPLDKVTYTAMLSSDSTFATGFTFGPLLTSSHPVPPGLLSRGVNYFWKASAQDLDSAVAFGNSVFRFRILQLGDVNADGTLNASDVVILLNYVFLGAPPIDPPELADLNCDGIATATDAVILLNAVFLGIPPPCDP